VSVDIRIMESEQEIFQSSVMELLLLRRYHDAAEDEGEEKSPVGHPKVWRAMTARMGMERFMVMFQKVLRR